MAGLPAELGRGAEPGLVQPRAGEPTEPEGRVVVPREGWGRAVFEGREVPDGRDVPGRDVPDGRDVLGREVPEGREVLGREVPDGREVLGLEEGRDEGLDDGRLWGRL